MLHAKSKQIFVRLLSLLLVVVALMGVLPISAFAAGSSDSTIELDGTFSGRFELNNNKDLMFDLKDIVPGDEWNGTIRVKNKTSSRMTFAIVSVVSNLNDKALFNALTNKIVINGKTVYKGEYGFYSKDQYMTKFYTIEPGKTLKIGVTVALPRTAGNSLMGKSMDSTWTFEARYQDSSYIVHYVDEDNVKLADSKVVPAVTGSTVTEKAIYIEGYKPDKEYKSIDILQDDENVIIFVYSMDDTFGEPGDDDKDNPKTGDDRRLQIVVSLVLMVILLIAIVVIYSRYKALARKNNEKKKNL